MIVIAYFHRTGKGLPDGLPDGLPEGSYGRREAEMLQNQCYKVFDLAPEKPEMPTFQGVMS